MGVESLIAGEGKKFIEGRTGTARATGIQARNKRIANANTPDTTGATSLQDMIHRPNEGEIARRADRKELYKQLTPEQEEEKRRSKKTGGPFGQTRQTSRTRQILGGS